MDASLWPLFDLRLRTGDIELRVPEDADIMALARLAGDEDHPIHDPTTMPFLTPWTDASPAERARSTVQWHWRARGLWQPDDWHLELVAVRDGTVLGSQGVRGRSFAVSREGLTGSWVGGRHQGQGVATAMRRAVLQLLFEGLGALTARSEAFADNTASHRVSEKLGYVPDGTEVQVRRGQRAVEIRLLLTRAAWGERRSAWPPVEMTGLAPCLALFGLAG